MLRGAKAKYDPCRGRDDVAISSGIKAMPYNGKMKQATIGAEIPTMILLSGQI